MDKIKVMIVDDQVLMRDGLSTILSIQEDIEVVAQAKDGVEALEIINKYAIDVILMDVRMPNMDGVTCTRKIVEMKKDIKIIILTTFDDDEYIINALSYGASGYLLKNIDGISLVKAVRDVVLGDLLLPSNIANKLAANIKKEKAKQAVDDYDMIELFTQREHDLVKLLIQGLNNREMADQLYLTEGTVKNYLTGIYSKIETSDRVNAILILQKLSL